LSLKVVNTKTNKRVFKSVTGHSVSVNLCAESREGRRTEEDAVGLLGLQRPTFAFQQRSTYCL